MNTSSLAPYGFSYRENKQYRAATRCIDIGVSLVALAASAPVLVVAALAVKIEDGGPIFFVQSRVGRFGRLFPMYKLRTMRHTVCSDAMKPSDGRDPRITRVGRYLRKCSIDEIPQLWNVLRGEMTLVGPRPEMPFLVRRYESWQQLDVEYISLGSIGADLRIILRTFSSLVSTKGAH
jgi:lipopolysaccharide/colanic/teichoic acid biosynthesis glycosyltransferase